MKVLFLLFCFPLAAAQAYDYYEENDPFEGKSSFNGFQWKEFGNFSKNWKLVTVRFRKDSDELRFVYANPIAWKVLQQNPHASHFPQGAIFAKIGIHTEMDAAFPSSAVPSGAKRVQFMVKDDKKFPTSDGWGYALFDGEGKTFPGDPKTAVVACHACHRLVPERGFVFSRYVDLTKLGKKTPAVAASSLKVSFVDQEKQKLNQEIQGLLPSDAERVRAVTGDLQKNLFEGTLDEIRPALTFESSRTRIPSILASSDGSKFTLVIPQNKSECTTGSGFTAFSRSSAKQEKPKKMEYCF